MQFTKFHNDFFSAKNGSFSRVTDRENYDSQITLTDFEADMVIRHFGLENIHVGNVGSNRAKSEKRFFLYPEFSEVTLNLVFPKPEKHELRLYIRSGFKPEGGMIWFLYKDHHDDLIIGFMEEENWNKIGQVDLEDESYQDKIEDALIKGKTPVKVPKEGRIVTTTVGSKVIFVRDPRIAIMRFQVAEYKCEINPSHQTFTSLATRLPYMEAHHFIPIKFQLLFDEPLDSFNNVTSLCPICHRGIHHAIIDHKIELIKELYKKRPELHKHSLDDISQFYNCITLPGS